MEISDWTGCYNESWKGEIDQAAFAHPAKFARGLVRRIYLHMATSGWLHPGQTVIDPFGGVALGALDALVMGYHWLGVELEPRFVSLGWDNILHWAQKYGASMPKFGSAALLQENSRCATYVHTVQQPKTTASTVALTRIRMKRPGRLFTIFSNATVPEPPSIYS